MAETVDIHVRIPVDLHKQLKERAEHENRSINNLLIVLLREALNKKPR